MTLSKFKKIQYDGCDRYRYETKRVSIIILDYWDNRCEMQITQGKGSWLITGYKLDYYLDFAENFMS
jgi:hypothetical protein